MATHNPIFYPVFLDLRDMLCVVVGGGSVAERKAVSLLQARARIRIVSPALTPALADLAKRGEFEYIEAEYSAEWFEGARLVFAATNLRKANAEILADARARGILVNVADAPSECDFIVPSLVRRGQLCIGISTGGASPMLAAKIADALESQFGSEFSAYIALLAEMRDYIKERTTDSVRRRNANRTLVDSESELIDLLGSDAGSDTKDEARKRAAQLVEAALSGESGSNV